MQVNPPKMILPLFFGLFCYLDRIANCSLFRSIEWCVTGVQRVRLFPQCKFSLVDVLKAANLFDVFNVERLSRKITNYTLVEDEAVWMR